jgi:hypothetical protein
MGHHALAVIRASRKGEGHSSKSLLLPSFEACAESEHLLRGTVDRPAHQPTLEKLLVTCTGLSSGYDDDAVLVVAQTDPRIFSVER